MALPIVRAWSGLDFEGGEFDVRSEATGVQKVSLESVLSNDFNKIFQSIQKIYFRWDPRQDNSPDPSEEDLDALGLTGGLPVDRGYGDGIILASSNPTFSIPYNIEDMKKLLGAYKGRKGVTFTVGPATDDSEIDYEPFSVEFNAIEEKLGAPGEKRFGIYELLGEPEPEPAPAPGSDPAPAAGSASAPADNNVKHRFVAYFKYMPTFGKTDEMLKGKLVSELAASQILDDAAISSIDVKDAAYRLAAYAKRAGQTQPEQYDSLSRIVEDLAAQFNSGEGAAPPDVNIAAANAVRRALIDKKMIPIRNMLMAKEDQEAGGKPTDIDAPTQEFERDSAADMCTVEMVKKTFREMVYTTAGALFSTASDATRIVGNVSSFDAGPEPGLISLGAIVYAGKTENFVTSGKLPGDDADRRARPDSAVSAVKEILLNNSIPINYALLVSRIEQVFKTSLENSIDRINKYAISTLARVEHAREIDLLYTPPTVYYGTDSESEYFGTGSNVTMITDCAFIAARVLNSLYEDGAFVQERTDQNSYWDAKFILAQGRNAGGDVDIIIGRLAEQIYYSYTGHCTVRTADMGRILGGSLVNTTLKVAITSEATRQGYRSLLHLSHPDSVETDEFQVEAKFYHQIWKHELGNHAVAQGGARLEESHMMVPFLVRATSDSEHVVPTLCAFDDWIGPTEMYERIEQSALMEIENYAQSRPTVKYAKGGRGRTLRDIGTMIKTAEDSVDPINMLKIIMSVEQGHRDKAATCCAMLMTAVHSHSTFSEEVKKGGLARQRASETKVRELAARIGNLPVN